MLPRNRIITAVVYIDDALFCGPTKAIVDEIKGLFMKKWECRDLGPAISFLNMRIKHDGHKILIDQCLLLENDIVMSSSLFMLITYYSVLRDTNECD